MALYPLEMNLENAEFTALLYEMSLCDHNLV